MSERWGKFEFWRRIVQEIANEVAIQVCGTMKRKRADWLTDEVIQLAEKKAELCKNCQASMGDGEWTVKEAYEKYRIANRACLKVNKEAKWSFTNRIARD